jgi:hypothetical protein
LFEDQASPSLINDGYLQHLRVAADAAIGADIMARSGL